MRPFKISLASVVLCTVLFVSCSAVAQFVQQAKLMGAGAVSISAQGKSAALSSDGNTAIVGGPDDNFDAGAAWIFTRSGSVWTQQGAKLVGTGAAGAAEQGWSVSISGDGNTAIVGGWSDNSGTGAVWLYTRSSGVWTQQGAKLVGAGAVGAAHQGYSVSLAGDGNTAIVGGFSDNGGIGAAWVFTRSGGVWTQQGAKLVGTGASGFGTEQGFSVALSADGNTAMVGGPGDASSLGAAWVFTRSGGIWSQQGPKLSGSGVVIGAGQGSAVSLSADGNTAVIGGPLDSSLAGAAWIFTRSSSVWTQQGAKLVGSARLEPHNKVAPFHFRGMAILLWSVGPSTTRILELPGSTRETRESGHSRATNW